MLAGERMNSRQMSRVLSETQVKEDVCLSYLEETQIQDLLISLDSLSSVTLNKIESVASALLQDRLRDRE